MAAASAAALATTWEPVADTEAAWVAVVASTQAIGVDIREPMADTEAIKLRVNASVRQATRAGIVVAVAVEVGNWAQ